MQVRVELPEGVRCAVALSYDLEMCAGYSPVLINHGRIMQPLRDYTLRLCDTAEAFGVQLHFFYVVNGLEEPDIDYLREILRRGHVIDNHTYSHMLLSYPDPAQLGWELTTANRELEARLGVESTVLRGPGGLPGGLDRLLANQQTILDSGFRWVSSHMESTMGKYGWEHDVAAPSRLQPYVYPTGLIEMPIQGWMDRLFFDFERNRDNDAMEAWRLAEGHRPVPDGWVCPWTDAAALDDWIAYNLAALDHAYDHGLLWVPTWHPYTHYLHDPANRALPALLAHARSKPEPVAVCTVRDAAAMLHLEAA